MENDRRLEILGILIIALSVFILVSLLGYNSNEEPSISPNIQIDNPMGILGLITSYVLVKKGFGYVSILLPMIGFAWIPAPPPPETITLGGPQSLSN